MKEKGEVPDFVRKCKNFDEKVFRESSDLRDKIEAAGIRQGTGELAFPWERKNVRVLTSQSQRRTVLLQKP